MQHGNIAVVVIGRVKWVCETVVRDGGVGDRTEQQRLRVGVSWSVNHLNLSIVVVNWWLEELDTPATVIDLLRLVVK